MAAQSELGAARRRAVVFAYHNVGVRCLRVLLDANVQVDLVVTHHDAPGENIWFGSVADLAREEGITCITPENPNDKAIVEQIAAIEPDFIFSFYYRQMLGAALLAIPKHGALNMHGSLLPKYRGRAPVNWAVLHGERHTGASLHYMVAKPDAGDLVGQSEVPILINDTAAEVFEKVTVAAELTLWRALPALLALNAPRLGLDLSAGSYFGGRKPEDGRIIWSAGALAVHNLIRAVAPPYPGAWFELADLRFAVHESRLTQISGGKLGDVPIFQVRSKTGAPADIQNGSSEPAICAALLLDQSDLLVVWPAQHAVADSAANSVKDARADALARLAPVVLQIRQLQVTQQACSVQRLRELLSITNPRAMIALGE